MYITNVYISGLKRFASPTNIALSRGMNVIVGDNRAGKSTVLEAIHMALSGTYRGKPLAQALTEDMFSRSAVEAYFASLKNEEHPEPPRICVELTFGGDASDLARFQGDGGVGGGSASGVGISIELDEDEFGHEFYEYVKENDYPALPIERDYFTMDAFRDAGKAIRFPKDIHPDRRNPAAVLKRFQKALRTEDFRAGDECKGDLCPNGCEMRNLAAVWTPPPGISCQSAGSYCVRSTIDLSV